MVAMAGEDGSTSASISRERDIGGGEEFCTFAKCFGLTQSRSVCIVAPQIFLKYRDFNA